MIIVHFLSDKLNYILITIEIIILLRMGEDNLESHPNWNAVLQWSLRLQDTEPEDRQLEPMDEEVSLFDNIVKYFHVRLILPLIGR